MEKTKAVHDYVATLVRYDYDALIDNKYQDEPSDALAVLDHPSAVCSGYSSLAAALLRALGIRARIVHGKATNLKGTFDHAWNEVYIDGEWKSLDVTWDDVVPIRYDYFLPSEANFILDHKKEIIMEYY
jgi:transglutaminase/protease-like cytokinesis protein 3